MLSGIILGYSFIFENGLLIALSTITTVTEFLNQLVLLFRNLLSQDPGYLFGLLFCFGVIVYDMKLIGSWWGSFHFAKEKKCSSCRQKMYREQRQMFDRILSFVSPVKRYRCVGCGKEYLIKRKHTETPVPSSDSVAVRESVK